MYNTKDAHSNIFIHTYSPLLKRLVTPPLPNRGFGAILLLLIVLSILEAITKETKKKMSKSQIRRYSYDQAPS